MAAISFDAILRGEDRAVARAISAIENDSPEAPALLKFLATIPKRAHRVGFTGPPASGKSTLLGRIAEKWLTGDVGCSTFSGWRNYAVSPPVFRMTRNDIGIIAIDPSSEKTGGAFLGDRTRMPHNIRTKGFFFRSMATRGNQHGIVDRLDLLMDVFDAAGKNIIAVETVGVGQSEIAIRQYVETLVLVFPPTGDDITYGKAGMMEIADVFVLNWDDLPTADRSFRQLCEELTTRKKSKGWEAPAFRTIATTDTGVQEVAAAIQAHHNFLQQRF